MRGRTLEVGLVVLATPLQIFTFAVFDNIRPQAA